MICEFKKEGTDILMFTHEMAFAKKVADHVVFIDEGKALEHTSAFDFFNTPKNN